MMHLRVSINIELMIEKGLVPNWEQQYVPVWNVNVIVGKTW
jgi:hypothetical protein